MNIKDVLLKDDKMSVKVIDGYGTFLPSDKVSYNFAAGDEECYQDEDASINLELESDIMTVDEAIERAGLGWGTLVLIAGALCVETFEGVDQICMSIIALIIKCEWGLSSLQVVFIEVSSFIGWMIGSFIVAAPSEIYGRKPPLVFGMTGLLLFTMACSFPVIGFWGFIVVRIMVGIFFGLASGPATVYVCELSPTKYRARMMSLAYGSYGFGMFLAMLFAYLVLGIFGLAWTWYIRILTILFVPSIFMICFMTKESPMFLANNQGDCEKAERILKKLCSRNKRLASNMKIIRRKEYDNAFAKDAMTSSDICQFIKKHNYLLYIVLAIILVIACSVCGVGFSFVAPRLMNENTCDVNPIIKTNSSILYKKADFVSCQGFDSRNLEGLTISEILQPLTPFICAIIADRIGRRATISSVAAIFFICVSCLQFCVNRMWILVNMFILQADLSALTYLQFLYTAEYFPTAIRSFVMGLAMSGSRIGVIIGIANSNWMYDLSPGICLGIFQTSAVVILASIFLLKKETANKSLE